jgi:pimeloyl-ACP methyl ester carboxylesterase/DNA-binding CsgD family transcriptional regulator
MATPRQSVHFTTTPDGVRLAYALAGKGPPILKTPSWLTHLEHDWDNPMLRHWMDELVPGHTLMRYDQRGCGLSDRDVAEISFDAWVRDMETAVDAAGLERFAIWGNSQGPAVAIAYAVRHPARVSHMVFAGAYCRGSLVRDPSPAQAERSAALLKLLELGWGQNNAEFLQVFASQFMPNGPAQDWNWLNEMTRRATDPATAVRISKVTRQMDITALAPLVRCPVLVLHSRGDAMTPWSEGRLMATLIPGAEFVTLDSVNHIVFADEPAWPVMRDAVRAFLAKHEEDSAPAMAADFGELSQREHEVLELIARGLDNTSIAGQLRISPRTVRNHINSVFAKVGARSRAQAIVRARDAGYGLNRASV